MMMVVMVMTQHTFSSLLTCLSCRGDLISSARPSGILLPPAAGGGAVCERASVPVGFSLLMVPLLGRPAAPVIAAAKGFIIGGGAGADAAADDDGGGVGYN